MIIQLNTICSDGGMFGYCSLKNEILIDLVKTVVFWTILRRNEHFYVLLLMAPLQAPLVTYGIVIKSQL